MIPLVPALVLAFLSLFTSAFVVLRIVLPILPPSPLSRRVPPSEFGLPVSRSLSLSNKCHLWLTGADLLALIVFTWHAISEAILGRPEAGVATASDPFSAARIWLYMVARQTCLCVIASLILLHVRLGRSLSLGRTHWRIWAPVIIVTATSTVLVDVTSGTEVKSLFLGLATCSGVSALLVTFIFAGLFLTLRAIKSNLATLHKEDSDRWPRGVWPGRTSFTTEEIEAIRDGASWFTSLPASTRTSMSSWSFSTHRTAVGSTCSNGRPQNSQVDSFVTKSAPDGFGKAATHVSPIPSAYATSTLGSDPFRRSLPPLPNHPRGRLNSQCSWLTSTDGSNTTLPAWSFPPSHAGSSACSFAARSPAANIPAGNALEPQDTSRRSLNSLAAPRGIGISVSWRCIAGWMSYIWVPMVLSLPYLVILAMRRTVPDAIYVLHALSVTVSSPLLALNLVFGSPLPVPTGLFDRADRTSENEEARNRVSNGPSQPRAVPSTRPETWRSLSSSPTVVEGCRSGDVWLKNGDAVDGKGKFSRAVSLLAPKPQISVIPPEECENEIFPPTPKCIPEDTFKTVLVATYSPAHSQTSAEFGRLRSSSKSRGSRGSVTEESQPTKIMVAQRHYSVLAQTIAVAPGTISEKQEHEVVNASGAVVHEAPSHLRTRSTTTSFSVPESPPSDVSLPPPFPLPPTPPSVRAARSRQSSHKSSCSSGYSFAPIESVNEIDELSAGVLPLLLPGLEIGNDVKITRNPSPLGSRNENNAGEMATIRAARKFVEGPPSSDPYSTPTNSKFSAPRKREYHPNHRRSLGLGKQSLHSTISDTRYQPSTLPPSSERPFEEFEAELHQKPHSHSTPQVARPPLPKASKPSSIVYVRPENVATSIPASTASRPSEAMLTQRPSRPGQSLIPRKIERDGGENRGPVPGKGRGLRPLKLLQDQDTNSVKSASSRASVESSEGKDENDTFRSLMLGKRQKARRLTVSAYGTLQDENGHTAHRVGGDVGPSKGLTRSDTNRQRAILRRTEVLPKLVVRPPSTVYVAI